MSGDHDRIIIARRPNGEPIYTTRWYLRRYGQAAVMTQVRALLRQGVR